MREEEARNFVLVRAVELEDREGALLTAEDRRQAELHARPHLRQENRTTESAYLAQRSAFAAARLATRFPQAGQMLNMSRWPQWLDWALALAAFLAGGMANELGNGRRLDLLAVPLLGALVWNGFLYLWLVARLLFRREPAVRRVPQIVQMMTRSVRLGLSRPDQATMLSRALSRFSQDWSAASLPLGLARARRALHLGAAFFALGLVASIYIRALTIEYRAGWESTFLEAGDVHAILTLFLGPASSLTGIALPSAQDVAALRWTSGSGDNAGRWIHLYVVTVLGVIVVPRLLLAGWQALQAYRLAAWFPTPGRRDFYTRRLLRTAQGMPLDVRVTSYAYKPAPEIKERFTVLLKEALGDRTQVRFDEPVIYGAEDEWLDDATLRPDDDYHILLFALSSTPEAENHGRLAAALRERLADECKGTVLAALLDESGFRRQFAGQMVLDARVDGRRQAWEAVLTGAGLAPLALDLAAGGVDTAQRLEAMLIQNPALEG